MIHEKKWIGVDLDGTLAEYHGWKGHEHIGRPIPAMAKRVVEWTRLGIDVKIFTARMCYHLIPGPDGKVHDYALPIKKWCLEHLGAELEVTNVKTLGMIQLWDDRAVQVEVNTGEVTEPQYTNRIHDIHLEDLIAANERLGRLDKELEREPNTWESFLRE